MQTDMNGINNSWNNTKWAETHIYIVLPHARMKMRDKGKQREKKT